MKLSQHLESIRVLLREHPKELRKILEALPEGFEGGPLPEEVEAAIIAQVFQDGITRRVDSTRGRYTITDRPNKLPAGSKTNREGTPTGIPSRYLRENRVLESYKTPLAVDRYEGTGEKTPTGDSE